MSLQLLAKQMEAKGRDGDSVLVHMTPGEVAGLQKLAESAGGSLTVNPETGLVEANFLKQMLPTLVGAGVGFFTANPMLGAAAGAAVGGYQANRAGRDVGEGMVMGGLGGYGGATLGSSLQAAGAPAVTGGGAAAAGGGGSTATNMATNAAANALLSGGQQAGPAPEPFLTPAQQQAVAGSYGMDVARTNAGTGAGAVPAQVPTNTAASGNVPAGTQPKFADMTYSQRLDQGIAGLKNFSTEEGRDKALKSMGGSEGVMRMLMMAGLPAMYGARTSVPHPYGLLSADINKRGFSAAEGGEVGFFTGGQTTGVISQAMANRPYIIDPATGNVIRNPNLPPPAPVAFANMVGSGGDAGGYTPNPDFVTPEQQSAYYRENPTMSRIAQTAQTYNPFATLQEYMDPGVTQRQGIVAAGLNPNQSFNVDGKVSGFNYDGDYDAFSGDRVSPGSGYVGGSDINSVEMAGVGPDAGMAGATEGGAGSTAATADSPDGPDGANASDGRSSGGGDGVDGKAAGGLLGLAKGGLKEGGFVVPADVVAFLGGGNSDNGAEKIERMFPNAMYIDGPDGGQEDTVKTSIEGKQPARVAHGEVYIPPQDVKRAGGAKALYAMLDRVRVAATGSKKQIKPVSLERAMA